nr:MAG TPA: hypothetical protein [Caudoviricetes sp.]
MFRFYQSLLYPAQSIVHLRRRLQNRVVILKSL